MEFSETIMSKQTHIQPSAQEDERNNPVFKFGRAVAIFMLLVWAAVLIGVFYAVFRFWLS